MRSIRTQLTTVSPIRAHPALSLLVLLLLNVVPTPAVAGTLSPGLSRLLAEAPGDSLVGVLVVLHDQVDARGLDLRLKTDKVDLAQRHRRVVEALQETAARSGGPLRAELETMKSAGVIRKIRSHWILNAVTVTARPAVVRVLAARPDVDVIEVAPVAALIGSTAPPVAKDSGDGVFRDQGFGVAPGVRAVWAPRAWHELGVDGTGAVVGVIDSGVDGLHPALASNWRGNVAPPRECWLDSANEDTTWFPVDNSFHGTHVMGTICGRSAQDTIGVAPGATWIASNAMGQHVGDAFDDDIFTSLEFMVDPDGDPATFDDVPDVVQNSWGIHEGFVGYFDCDTRWLEAVLNVEAAGVVLTWSAGNEGPYPSTVRSPADYATSRLSSFSVGAVEAVPPYAAADFSSRGPSPCGGPFSTKPEITAPGVAVLSSVPDDAYAVLSGTSMAGPHVAGVVALIRSADPKMDVDMVKQIIIDTAKDLGEPGEDNIYGHGMINAYDAVLAALDGYRRVRGRLVDVTTGAPVADAEICSDAGASKTMSDDDGRFELVLPMGPQTISWRAFLHRDEDRMVAVDEELDFALDFALQPAPTATVSGRVRTLSSVPVPDAVIEVLGSRVRTFADADGHYLLDLPVDHAHDLRAGAPGLGHDQRTLYVDHPQTVDFDLPRRQSEGFELGHFAYHPWVMSGGDPWRIDRNEVAAGRFSARSGDLSVNLTSELSLTADVRVDGRIRYSQLVSTEYGFDFLEFRIDGELMNRWSGIHPWTTQTFPVRAGTHTFTWIYIKDRSISEGADAVWIDEVIFPSLGSPPPPDIGWDPPVLEALVASGTRTDVVLRLENLGLGSLAWEAVASVAPVHRAEENPTKNDPNPDEYGYVWFDNLHPEGREFSWVEPGSSALEITLGDDDVVGPLPLGFPFPFYGGLYDDFHLSGDGWFSFAANGAANSGPAIPNPTRPNALIAPCWTDLNPEQGGRITSWYDPTGPRHVITWSEVPHHPDTNPETFQAILHPDGSLLFQYKVMADNTSHTIGIEHADGVQGMPVLRNAPYLQSGMAILIERRLPPELWLGVEPRLGVLAPSATTPIVVSIDASDLTPGEHTAALRLTTDDPTGAVRTVPVRLKVHAPDSAPATIDRDTRITAVSPNPFNPSVTFSIELLADEPIPELGIYDVSGRLVRDLPLAGFDPGRHDLIWNGRDDTGRALPSGVYLLRLRAAERTDVRKLQLLR